MKFKIPIREVKNVFQIVSAVAGDKVDRTMKTVVFHNPGDGVRLHADGPFASVMVRLPATSEPGTACVEFVKGFQMVRTLDGEMEVDIRGRWAHCRAGTVQFKCPAKVEGVTEPADTSGLASSVHDLDGPTLYRALHAASIAVGKLDHANLGLRGVHFKLADRTLTIEACDGKEAVRSQFAAGSAAEFDLLIPQQSLRFLMDLCDREGCRVWMRALPNELVVSFHGEGVLPTTLGLKLHAGTFPDVSRLMPAETELTVGAVVEQLVPALQRADTFSAADTVDLEFATGTITVSAVDQHGGTFSEEVVSVVELEAPVRMRVNAKNLIACFREMRSAVVDLAFDREPAVIRATPQAEGFKFTYVTFPHRMSTAGQKP